MNSERDFKLTLSNRTDGYGFITGQLVSSDGERFHNISILPPADKWDGGIQLPGYEPVDGEWILYADGEEIGRVSQLQVVTSEKIAALLEGANRK